MLAPGFELLFPPDSNMERLPDVWFAARIPYDNSTRNGVQHRVIARLKDGVTIGQAQLVVDRIAAETRKNFLISGTAGYAIRLEPMHAHVVAEVRPALMALLGAVAFLMLIACANVANLMLVRTSLRERELAVRTALGGSRWALVRQTLAEALVLAGAGAILGLFLADTGIRELRALAPANLPRLDTIAIDPLVIGFAILTAAGGRRHLRHRPGACARRARTWPSYCAAPAVPPASPMPAGCAMAWWSPKWPCLSCC